MEKISIKEAICLLDNNEEVNGEINQIDKKLYLNGNVIRKLYPEYSMDYKTLRRLADEGKIKSKFVKEIQLFSVYDVVEYKVNLNLFRSGFITIRQFLKKLGIPKPVSNSYYNERFLELHNNGNLKMVCINEVIKGNNYYILKLDLEKFCNNMVSLVEAAEIMGSNVNDFAYIWPKIGKPIIKIQKNNQQYHYIYKNDFYEYRDKKIAKHNSYSRQAASFKLNISPASFEKVVNEYSLTPVYEEIGEREKKVYFSQQDIEFLKTEQDKLWDYYLIHYYTRDEAKKYLNLTEIITRYGFTTVPIPPLLRTNRTERKMNKIHHVYLKSEIEEYKFKKVNYEKKRDIINRMDADPFLIFKIALKEFKYIFPPSSKNTEKFWLQFVGRKLQRTNASDDTKRDYIKELLRVTELIISNSIDRDILTQSHKELNLRIFRNKDIPANIKNHFISFIRAINKNLSKKGLKGYDLNKLDFKPIPNENGNEKSIYQISEYMGLLDYVGDISLHKNKAIRDAKNAGSSNYVNYASSWLYVLLHMNNAWRHRDITLFPRIDISKTRVDSLEWFEGNELTLEEAKSIINQVKSINFIHSKTQKRRYFFCSEELTLAFAYAAIICELRCKKASSKTLIDFNSVKRKFTNTHRKAFFSSFISTFSFGSRKMNRTLISYIYNVIKKVTKRNPLEITKFIRSHSDEEITNIYIDIPREHIDFLTNQLFEVGHFGYSYEILGDLLLGQPSTDRVARTNRSLLIKNTFGDYVQIETIAAFFNALLRERDLVKKVLNNHPDLTDLLNCINLGQQPAKQYGYQCVFQRCQFPEKECGDCPFVIPHIYALSDIGQTIVDRLNDFSAKFYLTDKVGEKTRLTNRLYPQLFLLKQAVEKFGEDTVTQFIPGGLPALKEELKKLPSALEYLTIRSGEKNE